jgi:hypothetical protein
MRSNRAAFVFQEMPPTASAIVALARRGRVPACRHCCGAGPASLDWRSMLLKWVPSCIPNRLVPAEMLGALENNTDRLGGSEAASECSDAKPLCERGQNSL